MNTTSRSHFAVRVLAECAVMLALSFALSFIGFEMPMGGKVTPASMLPLFFVAIHLGPIAATATGTLYALLQIWQAYLAGNVFVYCETAPVLFQCVLFDYVIPFILPFVLVGFFSHTWKGRGKDAFIYISISVGLVLRFLSHFVSGILIWGQWAEDMSPALYSFLYNGTFMLPELAIVLVVSFLLLRNGQIRKILRT